ncbi:long-chain-fatty-acid-- ligase [Fusarium sporotrichioides]|uniref:Long-chain-fatty-acid--ligase n=1 Tax=Fusarium sporotrichioides TaxID=5514 RepID=A0A395SIN4_FUSSP|nr:long-chain-fatty-acid-- ligase [Fusarium sporotrichioides]
MRHDSPAKPSTFGYLAKSEGLSKLKAEFPDPLSPVYARSRCERSRPPKSIEHDGSAFSLVGVNSCRELVLRDQRALHLDVRIECFPERVVVFDGIVWQVDRLEAIPHPLDFTKPPRRMLHLKRWTSSGEVRAEVDEPDNLSVVFPSSKGEHTLGPIKHGIVRMISTASRRRVLKPLEPGKQFEARLRGRELHGPFQIDVKKNGQLIANNVSGSDCLVRFAVEPHEIAPSYVRVNCSDFGGSFDIDSFLYYEDKLRCRATSVKAIRATWFTNDRAPMFGTLRSGQVPLLTNGLKHLEVFEKFIRDNMHRGYDQKGPRQLTILNLSMCDQGDAKIVMDALIDFRKHNLDAKISIVVSKLGPTAYLDTMEYQGYIKLLEAHNIHVDMFTGVEGPTRQVVHAKAMIIDDRTLFSTGAIVDTKPIDKADFSIELPSIASKAFRTYVQDAILDGASDERRAQLAARLASLGVIINDPIASLTYISRAQHTLLRGARRDLLVSVSELVDPKITKLLVRRAANGVTVTIQIREIDDVSSKILTKAIRRYGKRISVEDPDPKPPLSAI